MIIARKLLQLVVVFIVVTFFTVFLMSLVPGKPEEIVIPFDNSPGQVVRKQFIEIARQFFTSHRLFLSS